MLVASLISTACPIGVLLGGSGIRRTVALVKPDVGALLMQRKPYLNRNAFCSVSAASVTQLREVNHHD